MKFVSLRDKCRQSSIDVPDFPFLRPDSQLFKTLLFQPEGDVKISPSHIGIQDAGFVEKFNQFLKLAGSSKADLVMSPEYSCPWESLESIIQQGNYPEQGKLWVLGCASISPAELYDFISKHSTASFVLDTEMLREPSMGHFLDCVAIMFLDKDSKLTIVLQFKQQHMGVHFTPLERDNIVQGKEAYLIQNTDPTSISLAILICSDSLDFTVRDLAISLETSLLLLHIQLNPDPRNHHFSQYRTELFNLASQNKEVICLNWGTKTTFSFNGKSSRHIEQPHSGVYTKSPQLDLSDDRVHQNHDSGLYIFNWDQYYATLFATAPEEHCLEIISTKVAQVFPNPSTNKRTGPVAHKYYEWKGSNWALGSKPDDGCYSVLANAGMNKAKPLANLKPLELERFVCLGLGHVYCVDWDAANQLFSLKVRPGEVLARLSYARDPRATVFVAQMISSIKTLYDCFSKRLGLEQQLIPELSDKFLDYKDSSKDTNIFSPQGPFATAIYLTILPQSTDFEKIVSHVLKAISQNAQGILYIWWQNGATFSAEKRTSGNRFNQEAFSSNDINRGNTSW